MSYRGTEHEDVVSVTNKRATAALCAPSAVQKMVEIQIQQQRRQGTPLSQPRHLGPAQHAADEISEIWRPQVFLHHVKKTRQWYAAKGVLEIYAEPDSPALAQEKLRVGKRLLHALA